MVGMGVSVHTPERIAPAAARLSMGLENSKHAGWRPILVAQKSTMPPVVEPIVCGRHKAHPAKGLPYKSGLFWSEHVAFLSPNISAF